MRVGRSWFVLAMLVVLGDQEVLSTQWKARVDLGIAAVDRRTGNILWEAWDESDLPADVTADVRRAARTLFGQQEPNDAGVFDPRFPLVLAEDRLVTYLYNPGLNRIELVLTSGTEKAPGAELARFFVSGGSHPLYAVGAGIFYVLNDGHLYALSSRGGRDDGTWPPDWTFDLARPDDREKAVTIPSWTLRVDGDALWVADDRSVRRFGASGQVELEHVIANPWAHVRNGFNASVAPGKRLVYYRHGTGVIAVDRATSREAWRVPTWRSPYPSRVLEVDDLVLIQMGSDCPQTILRALGQGAQPLPRSGPDAPRRLVAATALLRAYGDGYPRAELRQWITRVQRGRRSRGMRQALLAIQGELEDWPARRDRQRLIDHTVDALLAAPESRRGSASRASHAVERALAWTLLQELIYGKPPDGTRRPGTNYAFDTWDENALSLSEARRLALLRECRRVLAEGGADEKGLAAGVLLSDAVGWSAVRDPELAALFQSPDEFVWRWAGMSLARHGRRDELVELAKHRPPEEHLSVIYMLANAPSPCQSAAEKEFWLACARRTPASIAYLLNLVRPAEIPREYREPIREYLVTALRKAMTSAKTPPNETTQREYDLNAALRVLDRWQDPEDTPLLESYVTYPHPFVSQHAKALRDARQPPATSTVSP